MNKNTNKNMFYHGEKKYFEEWQQQSSYPLKDPHMKDNICLLPFA